MATAQGIRAGRAFVELFADDSKLVRGLGAAERKLKAFGDGVRNLGLKMVGVGSAILAPLAGAAKSFADMGSRMWDMAKRTGVSVEALSALGYAAEQSGAGMEAFENGIRLTELSETTRSLEDSLLDMTGASARFASA